MGREVGRLSEIATAKSPLAKPKKYKKKEIIQKRKNEKKKESK